ncbi:MULTISPECIES: alpha/beta hydrolase [unclassified Streptomyces]|uniref:alpha/beta hydrolase n=1 Tax=unclassified Streptomyces TaxID=2593676 RepID=UPI000C274ADE|nr:alpha/beta hydrolase [Streptomyces sp. CB01201]PJM98868.1 alpha/beta hydrolase [Streptomyces sp. CB01201]
MTDVIILHGAWHQPAHYADLADQLHSRGLSVEVPDLYGLSLAESTAKVEAIVSGSSRPPVVVGHSFGGVTAGTVRGAASLVFLNSWILDVDESPAKILAETPGEPGEGLLALPDADGRLHLDPDDARTKLFGDISEPAATRALELLRPEPLSIFNATPTHVSWRDTPSLYLRGRRDRTIVTPLPDRFAGHCSRAEMWDTSHSPYLSRPAAVADLIQRQRAANGS